MLPRTPWAGLESEIDRLFETAFSDTPAGPSGGVFPVDLYEDKDNTFVRAELPGVKRDAIQVEVVDGYLTIQAERTVAEGEDKQSYAYSRSIALSDDVKTDDIRAQYENGVLTVTLPKKEEAKPRKVTVQVS